MSETKIKLPLRSVSQINQFTRCPMAYKLSRIDKVWARPAAWLGQGKAFHTVAETYEQRLAAGDPMTPEEALELFNEEYSKEIGLSCAETPNFDFWFWSGPYNGERDIERRFHVGREQVEKFIAWRNMRGQEIWWTPYVTDPNCSENHDHVAGCGCKPSVPAIEIGFKIDLDGILVRGFIDAVVVEEGELRVRDYKTGNAPGDDFQLGVYALAISMVYGVPAPKTGDYYMAGKKGKKSSLTHPYDLTEWTREAITAKFHDVEEKIQEGTFEALPDRDKCAFCDVNLSCPVFNA